MLAEDCPGAAFLTLGPDAHVLADLWPETFFTNAPHAIVLADACPVAFFTVVRAAPMHAMVLLLLARLPPSARLGLLLASRQGLLPIAQTKI